MNILMLNPPFKGKFSREQRSPAVTKSGTLYYPMWLAYATGLLEKQGFNVKLIDAPANNLTENDCIEITKDFKPELIVIDTSTPSIYNDVKVGEIIKSKVKSQKSKVVLVGTHVSATAEESLKISAEIDIVCRGEYDYTLLDIAKSLELRVESSEFEEIKGISFRKNNQIIHNPDRPFIEDLDKLPFVSQVYKKYLNYKNYFYAHSQHPIVTIIGGRGCPHRCAYCVYPQVFSGRKLRFRSVENTVDELEYIKRNFKEMKEIMFEDDTLTLNKKRCRALCEEILSRKLNIKWSANSRADVDFETLRVMKKAGCRLLCVGFESGEQKILDNMHKGIKIETIREFVNSAKKAGILIHGCFLVGNSGETKNTLEKTLEFAKELNPDTAQFFPIMVYPGTEAYDWAKDNRFLVTEDYREWLTPEGLHNCVVSRPGLTNKELVGFCDRARREFYIRPSYIARKSIQAVRNPREGKRTLKSFKTFARHLLNNSMTK